MPDEVLEMEARLKNFISGELRVVVKDLKNLDNETKNTSQGVGALQKNMDRFASTVKRIAVGYVASRVFGIINKDLKESIQLYREQVRATARVNAAIKSTGGVAGVTQEEVALLANSLQKVTTVGNEVTESGAAMLLTFTNIGDNIFPRATETMLDMAAAFGQGEVTAGGVQQAAIQLGKALNDPIVGATALRRVGVSLTDQHLDHIKVLVKQNKLLEAQKIILDELQVEFGGMARELAKTEVGKFDQITNEIADLKEEIGKGLLPYLREWRALQRDILVMIRKKFVAPELIFESIKPKKHFQEIADIANESSKKHAELNRKYYEEQYAKTQEAYAAMQKNRLMINKKWLQEVYDDELLKLSQIETRLNNVVTNAEKVKKKNITNLGGGGGGGGGGGDKEKGGLVGLEDTMNNIRQMEIDLFGKPLAEDTALDYEMQKLELLQDKWDKWIGERKRLQAEIDRVAELSADFDLKRNIEAAQKKIDLERSIQQAKYRTAYEAINLLGMISQASGAQGKDAKAFAVGQAVMNTAVSATKTASATPYPWNIPLVALAIAQGAAQLAIINRQKFAAGGVVQGALTGDRNVIGANAGEMVLTQAMQRELLAALSGSRGANNVYNNSTTRNLGGVTINIAGRSNDIVSEINQAVRDRRLDFSKLLR